MEIKNVTCVGAGLVGQGWATVFATRGYDVVLHDISQTVLEEAVARVAANLNLLEQSGFISPDETKVARAHLKTVLNLEAAVGSADYVQESVPDVYELKRQVFRLMDALAPGHAILASSASGLMMTPIQTVTSKPERCLLVHPILPVHLIPVVEIAGGEKTSPETVATARDFMTRLGKIPVVLKKEVSGYIVNRIQAAILREAIDLVDQGVASPEDIDRAFCMGIGLRDPLVGPFLRMHLAGDGVAKFLKNYSQSYRYRWESMNTWTTIPPSAEAAVIKGVKEMEMVRTGTLDEIKDWRDKMLVKILRLVKEGRG